MNTTHGVQRAAMSFEIFLRTVTNFCACLINPLSSSNIFLCINGCVFQTSNMVRPGALEASALTMAIR